MKRIIVLILFSCFLTACASPYHAEELQQGKAYFKEGDYKKAYQQLLPVAVAGNAEAQYAVGYLIYYGYGVERDATIGEFWIKKAADQRYEPAMKALKKMK